MILEIALGILLAGVLFYVGLLALAAVAAVFYSVVNWVEETWDKIWLS